MKLFTKIENPKGIEIHYSHSIFGMGSCFVEHIGRKLEEGKFKLQINPFGIIYNPISIAHAIERIIDNGSFELDDLFEHQGLWHSWMHHGEHSQPNPSIALSAINEGLHQAHIDLEQANILFITLGTSWVYRLKNTGAIVANCHKMPAALFQKERLSVEAIRQSMQDCLDALKRFNPQLQVIFTVSPVRHIRDGIIENQRSKAALLLAVESLCKNEHVSYFPSYEILMDELRDYRFYHADLVHPNDVAIEYIWGKLQATHFSNPTIQNYKRVMKIVKGFQHRALHPNHAEHLKFLRVHIEKTQQLMKEIPVDFQREINGYLGQLELFE